MPTFRFPVILGTKAADQDWILAPLWNTWARAPSFLFPVGLALVATSFPFPVHRDGALVAPSFLFPFPVKFGALGALVAPSFLFPFPVKFGAKNLRQAGCAYQWQQGLCILVE